MTIYVGFDLWSDGELSRDMALELRDGQVASLGARDGIDLPRGGIDLSRDGLPALLTRGLVDLQVNGGGGCMVDGALTDLQLRQIAAAHWETGTAAILPTLISDTREASAQVIDAVATAQELEPGILGLHLEGPHIAIPGAHDPARLRPLQEADIALYLEAKARLGTLLLTVAPEMVELAQIRILTEAGILVSLGHSACTHEAATAAFDAGAAMATHLFNAMSGLHHRAPGLVGAVLDRGVPFGLIADGVHVHPAALRIALRASPTSVILVSDAMAVAGTGQDSFALSGREVYRRDGRLTLADGTLAGADLTLVQAVENLGRWTEAEFGARLCWATDAPWRLLQRGARPILPGEPARFLVWRDGRAEARIDGTGLLPLTR